MLVALGNGMAGPLFRCVPMSKLQRQGREILTINREFPSMSAAAGSNPSVPWWKEPTKDQWYAYIAAWLGWTLDAFDFTVFLLIMPAIAQYFGVSMLQVTFVFTITLW